MSGSGGEPTHQVYRVKNEIKNNGFQYGIKSFQKRFPLQVKMKKYIAILLLTFSGSVYADISGKVVAVTYGDTIKVLDSNNVQHKVRLTGIDAPEKAQ